MASANGKGRTLFEILTGRNKRDTRPMELRFFNPLSAKVGQHISIEHEPELKNINFEVDKISVYETLITSSEVIHRFYHCDLHLRGLSLRKISNPYYGTQDENGLLRFRLRLIKDDDETNKLGCKVQLLHLYYEQEHDESLLQVLQNQEFHVNQDDLGNELEVPRIYWRVEGVPDPYKAKVTVLADKNRDGTIEENELERHDFTYWDFARDTEDEYKVPYREFLTVEMKDKTGYLIFLRGTEVNPSQLLLL